jgi:hypothetical protein
MDNVQNCDMCVCYIKENYLPDIQRHASCDVEWYISLWFWIFFSFCPMNSAPPTVVAPGLLLQLLP